MIFPKHLLFVLASLISIQMFSQVPIKGDFILGDSTQMHRLTTINGDMFTGRVTGIEGSSLKFLYRNNNLEFNLEEVKMVEVLENQAESKSKDPMPPSSETDEQMTAKDARNYIWHFDYKITTTDGIEYLGKLATLNKYAAILEQQSKEVKIGYIKIAEIALIGKRITSNPNHLTEYHRLKTKKGDSFTGQLISVNKEELVFLMKNGSEITITNDELINIVLEKNASSYQSRKQYKKHKNDYNQHRLFFSPSALMLKQGDSEFRTMLLHNTIEHGFTNNFTAGGGLFSILVGHALTGKVKLGVSISDMVHVAVGAQGGYAFTVYGGDGVSLGLFYGAMSIGTSDRYINVSIGRGRDSDASRGTTAFTIGGSFRTNENWRIYIEYFHFQDPYISSYDPQNSIFGTLGLSWLKGQHQVDFGIFVSNDFTDAPGGFPVVAYNYRF